MDHEIKIKSNVSEQKLMETLLNMKHSGVDKQYILFVLVVHALAHKWHFDTLNYYLKELDWEQRIWL